MDPVVVSVIVAVLAVILAALLWTRSRSGATGSSRPRPQPVAARGEAGAPPVAGARGRRGGTRMRRPARQDEEAEEAQAAQDREEREELEEAGLKVPEGKIGKKKMEKLQAKADRKLAREAEEREREESKKKKAEQEEKDKKDREREEQEEKARKEQEQREREEKERKEQEEYLKMKEAFQVEEEGFDEEEEDEQENKLKIFVDYIKACIGNFDHGMLAIIVVNLLIGNQGGGTGGPGGSLSDEDPGRDRPRDPAAGGGHADRRGRRPGQVHLRVAARAGGGGQVHQAAGAGLHRGVGREQQQSHQPGAFLGHGTGRPVILMFRERLFNSTENLLALLPV